MSFDRKQTTKSKHSLAQAEGRIARVGKSFKSKRANLKAHLSSITVESGTEEDVDLQQYS